MMQRRRITWPRTGHVFTQRMLYENGVTAIYVVQNYSDGVLSEKPRLVYSVTNTTAPTSALRWAARHVYAFKRGGARGELIIFAPAGQAYDPTKLAKIVEQHQEIVQIPPGGRLNITHYGN